MIGTTEDARRAMPATRATVPGPLRDLAASERFWLIVAVVLGLGIRLYYVLPASFPLNDGGLFYAMARDIRDAGYAWPEYSSFNHSGLPFGYPPLFIYVLAFLDDVTPLSAFDLLIWLPLLISVATIPVFYLVARTFLPSKVGVAVAVLVFATIQNGFEWHIMGGGITRAPALLFSLLAVLFAYRSYRLEGWTQTALATLFASLALLSHPDLFVVLSVALLFVVYGRSRQGLGTTMIIAGGVALLTAPWWGTVIARHGLDTLLSAAGSRTEQGWVGSGFALPLDDFLEYPFTKQPLLNWPAVLAIVGGSAALATGQFFPPLWMVAEVLVEPHQAPNFVHAPVALLVGFAAGTVLAPAWRMLAADRGDDIATLDAAHSERASGRRAVYWRIGTFALAGYFAVIMLFSVLNEPGQLDHMKPLEKDQRELMTWVDANVPAGSPVLVVTGLSWWGDRTSEWFPALTSARSLFTVQGAEWFGDVFNDLMNAHGALQECGEEDAGCLDRVAQEYDAQFEYVYVSSGCCEELAASLRQSPDYRIVHEEAGGIIASRLR